MRHAIPYLAAAAMVVAGATAVRAQDDTYGAYISGAGGANFLHDMDFSSPLGGGTVNYETGWVASGAIGVRSGRNTLLRGLRGELEVSWRDNGIDEADLCPSCDGDINALGTMANLLYDFDLGLPVIPYIGVGLGAARVDAEVSPVAGVSFDDKQWAFAYQAIGGASLRLIENLEAFAEYRYFATQGLDLEAAGVSTDDEYRAHSVLLGVRFTLWAPKERMAAAPAPAPAAAPPPPPEPRNYLVFFDWDRASITPQAREIIGTAASNAKQGGVSRLAVTGHADRSGDATYNMGLSQERAQNVASELMREGIAANEIVVTWKGETQPLVPTDDGVREPQNRRVEIVVE